MKASKFTDAQKAFILKQGTDGMPVADIGRARLTRSRSKHIHATYRRGVFCNTEINGAIRT